MLDAGGDYPCIGNGGLKGWAQESILDIPMINGWENTYRMPIMFTATCEFSQYDDPKSKSAGVLAMLKPIEIPHF